jgi:hypothetical protein
VGSKTWKTCLQSVIDMGDPFWEQMQHFLVTAWTNGAQSKLEIAPRENEERESDSDGRWRSASDRFKRQRLPYSKVCDAGLPLLRCLFSIKRQAWRHLVAHPSLIRSLHPSALHLCPEIPPPPPPRQLRRTKSDGDSCGRVIWSSLSHPARRPHDRY